MAKRATGLTLAGMVCWAAAAVGSVSATELSAGQIVEKNIAARGGQGAWQKIETMVWVGHIESAHAPIHNLPFILEMKRPDKSRFEIKAPNLMSARVYDGSHGWKLNPASGGQPELQPYSAEELDFARDGQGLEMPFMNYQAKDVVLEGIDDVDGHKAYRLRAGMPSGAIRHVWIDSETFLVVKYDRQSRNIFGQSGTVLVSYRDYRKVDGLRMPFILESGVGSNRATDKMVIDKVVLNPPLDDRTFARPALPLRRNKVLSRIYSPPPGEMALHGTPKLSIRAAPGVSAK